MELNAPAVSFPPFLLDLRGGRLLDGEKPIHLRPRTWEVLCHLVGRRGSLVTKDELMTAVWSDAVVSEGTLTNSIRELRQALGDDARAPRFIETVHRRGFRFIGGVAGEGQNDTAQASVPARPASGAATPASPLLVGRDADIALLLRMARATSEGRTGVVLVSGEAGIGKSSLVDGFLAILSREHHQLGLRAVVGRAVGYLQGAPPYLPLVAAVEELATGDDGERVVASLKTHAPELLAQMPWLESDGRSPTGGDGPVPASGDRHPLAGRLLRLFAEICAHRPLVLVLEDLHDADAPTIEFLRAVLHFGAALPFLVVATFRSGEAVLADNGLAETSRAIPALPGGTTIDLNPLGSDDVANYLSERRGIVWTDRLVGQVHRQSGGNPLFMVTVADTLELTGAIGAQDEIDGRVPDSLRGLLDAQLRTLDYRQREILVAAAAVGVEFSSLAVAAVTGAAVDAVEAVCEQLASQGRFVRGCGVVDWPSGNVGQLYSFRHELYRKVLHETLAPPRRALLHQRIGEALERGYAGATAEIAAELADHFGRSGDRRRSVAYLREAAVVARGRFAHRESLALLDRAAELLMQEPAGAERDQQEFGLQIDRAASAGALHGYGSVLARETAERVEDLGHSLPVTMDRFFGLLVLFGYQVIRSDIRSATRVAARMTRMAAELDSAIPMLGARGANGMAATARGDLAMAQENLEIVLAEVPREFRLTNFRDTLVPSLTAMAQNLCYLGQRDRAELVGCDAIARADWLGDHFERASARLSVAYCAAVFGDRETALRHAEAAGEIADRYGIEEMASVASILEAWADSASNLTDRRRRMRLGIGDLDKTGHLLGKSFFLSLLADLDVEGGDLEAAAASLTAARDFCDTTGAHRHLAELHRQTAALEDRTAKGRTSARRWRESAQRIARSQGCVLLLERLARER